MNEEQKKHLIKILEDHDIGFISEDIFIFVDKLILDAHPSSILNESYAAKLIKILALAPTQSTNEDYVEMARFAINKYEEEKKVNYIQWIYQNMEKLKATLALNRAILEKIVSGNDISSDNCILILKKWDEEHNKLLSN